MIYFLFICCLLLSNVVNVNSVKAAVAFLQSQQQVRCPPSSTIYTARSDDFKKRWEASLSLRLVGKGTTDASLISSTESFHYKKRPAIGVYLLSFPNLYQHNINNNNAKSDSDVGHVSHWRKKIKQWKQYCLGDGGVYFDERPETLKALNVLLCKSLTLKLKEDARQRSGTIGSDATNVTAIEVAVLSTCARFEVLSVVQYTECEFLNVHMIRDVVRLSILEAILEQILYHQNRLSFRIQQKLPFNLFDRPSRICNNASHLGQCEIETSHILDALSHDVYIAEGVKDISERLCLIAAGLLDRPLFRPFSSRDSHVMHQLKQSSSCAATSLHAHADQITVNSASKYCKTLIDAALQSGKGARSLKVVPILQELREASNGANGPPDLSAIAAESAVQLAVRPAVSMCVSKFKAFQAAESIVGFRQNVAVFVKNATGGKMKLEDDSCANVRKLLHRATIQLREGNHVDIDEFLREVAAEISRLTVSKNV